MEFKVKESGNIIYMSRQNKVLISKKKKKKRLDSSWALKIWKRTKFYISRIPFVLSPSFFICCSHVSFFPSHFIASPFHRHYVKQNINQVS